MTWGWINKRLVSYPDTQITPQAAEKSYKTAFSAACGLMSEASQKVELFAVRIKLPPDLPE